MLEKTGSSPIFDYSELVNRANDIRAAAAVCNYDHRSKLPIEYVERVEEAERRVAFERTFQSGYAAFKYSVAAVLQPKTICEIGIGWGVSGCAFASAVPGLRYIGIDNKDIESRWGVGLVDEVISKMQSLGASVEFIQCRDSRSLRSIPKSDMVHIDGCHLYDWASHDTKLAIRSGSEWVLVDDARDSQVSAGFFRGVMDCGIGGIEWAYFEDTWTGSILMRNAPGKRLVRDDSGNIVGEY